MICATGFGDIRDLVKQLTDPEIAKDIKPVWGLNKEGELNSAYRWCGVPGLYFMLGNLGLSRFHSKHLALREYINLKDMEG